MYGSPRWLALSVRVRRSFGSIEFSSLARPEGLGEGVGRAVGIGAGFDNGAIQGQSVYARRAKTGSVKVLLQPENHSLEAIAMEFLSSRSVRTCKRSSALRRSNSI